MKTVGIIAEYNPFHNGHKYQIQKAKELTGADTVIVIMSGSFTQQGNIAVVDKFKRAEMAIKSGADLVIELPTIYAVSSAEMFAYGAVSILDKLNIVDYLVFGIECYDIDILDSIATKLVSNTFTVRSRSSFVLNLTARYSLPFFVSSASLVTRSALSCSRNDPVRKSSIPFWQLNR